MKIAGVKINGKGKVLYYDPNGLNLKKNLTVIVKDDKGLQFATVEEIIEVPLSSKYDNIVRIATKKDYNQHLKNISDSEKAIIKCRELVKKNDLNMTILDATYNFDRSQLLFRFLSDERVDFRQLAKDLGFMFKTRIELRQIGIRDKAKELGGFGPCGRILCCNTFLTSFDSVSINMAKNQSLALNPTKINGVCGRLLCCLNYENEQYMEAKKDLPDIGSTVKVDGKEGKVIAINYLLGKYRVDIDEEVVEVDINDSKESSS